VKKNNKHPKLESSEKKYSEEKHKEENRKHRRRKNWIEFIVDFFLNH